MGNTEIAWSCLYGLSETIDSDDAWSVSVIGMNSGEVVIDIAQPGDDLNKEFDTVESARDWLSEFVGNRYLEPQSEFDFYAAN